MKAPEVLGAVEVYDSRRGYVHRLDVRSVELRGGQLWIEAACVSPTHGSIRNGDVVTVRDPDDRIVTRYWLSMLTTTVIEEGQHLTLMVPISLGGSHGMAYADPAKEATP